MRGSLTSTLRGLLPGGVVFLLAVCALWTLEDSLLEVVTVQYSLVLYGVGSLLAWVFHRSRIFIGLLGHALDSESAVPLRSILYRRSRP